MTSTIVTPWVAASGPVPVASGKATKRARAYGDLWANGIILPQILPLQNVTQISHDSPMILLEDTLW